MTTPEPIATLTDDWERLADELDPSPFGRAGWAAAWWGAFGHGKLEVHHIRDPDLRALMPTWLDSGRRSSLTNWHSAASGMLAADADALAGLTTSLVADRPHQLTIQFLDADAWQTEVLVEGLHAAHYAVNLRPQGEASFMAIEGGSTDHDAGLSAKARSDLNRRRRQLAEAGRVTVEIADGSERLDALLDEGFAVEGSGWKQAAGTAITSKPETEHFYRSVAKWAARTGHLFLAFLRLDGRCIAFEYNLVAGGTLYGIKNGYDQEYRRFGPGKQLQAAVVQHAFENGLRRFEFLGVAEAYKLQWATGVRQVVTLRAFAPTVSGRALLMADRYGRPIGKRLRDVARGVRSPARGPARSSDSRET